MMKLFKKALGLYSRLNLKSSLFLSAVLLIIIFLPVSSYFSYRETTNIILNNIDNIDESNLKQISNNLTSLIGEMKVFTRNLSRNDFLTAYVSSFSESGDDLPKKMQMQKNILSLLIKSQIFYSEIDFIDVYINGASFRSKGGYSFIKYERIIESDIYKRVKTASDNIDIIEPRFAGQELQGIFSGISFGSLIYEDGKEIGILFVTMKQDWIKSILGSGQGAVLGSRSSPAALLTGSETTAGIYSEVLQFLAYDSGNFSHRFKNELYKIHYMKLEYNDWIVMTLKRVSDLSQPLSSVRNLTMMAILISAIVSFMLSRFISTKITRPVYALIEKAREYSRQEKNEFVKTTRKKRSFREVVMIYLIVSVTLPVLIYNITFYLISSRTIENKVKESILLTFEQTVNNIDSFFEKNIRISSNIVFSPYVQNYMYEKLGETKQKQISNEGINKEIYKSMSLGNNFFETRLYGKKGELFFSTSEDYSGIMDKELYQKTEKTMGESFWTYDHKNRRLLLTRKINGIGNDRYPYQHVGYISMSFFETSIEKLYNDISLESSDVSILDNNGIVVSGRSKLMIGQRSGYESYKNHSSMKNAYGTLENKGGSKFLIVYAASSKIPWILAGKIPYNDILKDNKKVLQLVILIQVILISIMFFISYKLSYSFTKSINRLNQNLIRLGADDIDIDLTEGVRINEIEDLGRTFNNMTGRIHELAEEVYSSQLKEKELQNEKKDAELVALQAQINPHFLYNTLESIKWMIMDDRKDSASEMVSLLGDLFRIGISNGRVLVTIEEEVDYAKTYVHIQKKRFGKKLKSKWFVDKTTISYMTPKLILQPLIENSIHHGIEGKDEGGTVSIYCREEDSSIIYEVVDEGAGMTEKRLEQLRNALSGKLAAGSIGMYNVQKRIRLYFGEAYGISVDSRLDQGTTVTVRIPKIEKS